MRTFRAEGIIIKRNNTGETDRILTFFSKNYGKIQVRAPGVRKITSRRSPHIELLNLSLLNLYRSSRSSLSIVTEAQTLEDFSDVKKSLEKIGVAFYICELINSFCPENQENKNIFFLLKNTLLSLDSSFNISYIIDNFEKELLELLGFMPKSFLLKNRQIFIENILEKKLKTKRILPLV